MEDYRPATLTNKQDGVIRLVAQYIAYSSNPSRFQQIVRERTKHNHNFSFLMERDKAYDYYRYVLHAYLEAVRRGYHRQQQDQFSDAYAQQWQQQWQEQQPQHSARWRQRDTTAAPNPSSASNHNPVEQYYGEPAAKAARTEGERHHGYASAPPPPPTAAPNGGLLPPPSRYAEDDDEDDGPQMRIVIDENGVQRLVPS